MSGNRYDCKAEERKGSKIYTVYPETFGMEEAELFVFTEEDIREMNRQELLDYEAKNPMAPAEKRALRKWVAAGHSVHGNPDSKYICLYGAWPPPDFLSVYRMDKEIEKNLKWKTKAERITCLKEYVGYRENPDEGQEKESMEKSPEQLKEELRKLKREVFHIWDFIGEKGLWHEAEEYMDRYGKEPMPFED